MLKNLYHYTNNDALVEIINNNSLRFSHFFYQNDPRELRYGLDLLLNIKDEIEQICPDSRKYIETIAQEHLPIPTLPIFTFSLSQKDDLLSQWRGYGNGHKSVCIGLKKDQLMQIKNENVHLQMQKIIYDESKQKNKLIEFFSKLNKRYQNNNARLLNFLANNGIFSEIINILIGFKHCSWKEEQEWRLIASVLSDSLVNFLGGAKSLKPYIDIRYETIPISLIRIPQSGYEFRNKSSIEWLLRAKNKDGIIVDISDFPIAY